MISIFFSGLAFAFASLEDWSLFFLTLWLFWREGWMTFSDGEKEDSYNYVQVPKSNLPACPLVT
jgi:hypothetical protein